MLLYRDTKSCYFNITNRRFNFTYLYIHELINYLFLVFSLNPPGQDRHCIFPRTSKNYANAVGAYCGFSAIKFHLINISS